MAELESFCLMIRGELTNIPEWRVDLDEDENYESGWDALARCQFNHVTNTEGILTWLTSRSHG
ncbi:MAG: hypothetical protein ACLU4N_02045 [Butyricimonas faecihominis]